MARGNAAALTCEGPEFWSQNLPVDGFGLAETQNGLCHVDPVGDVSLYL